MSAAYFGQFSLLQNCRGVISVCPAARPLTYSLYIRHIRHTRDSFGGRTMFSLSCLPARHLDGHIGRRLHSHLEGFRLPQDDDRLR